MTRLKMIKKVGIHVLVDPEIDKALNELALATRRTKTSIVEEAIKQYLERTKTQ